MKKTTGKRIFVSHAASDQPLADAFVNLLRLGLEISAKDIFCTSLTGMGIKAGEDFINRIKAEIQEPTVIIVLVTQNYLASTFCMFELGAAWAMSHNILPVLAPPLEFSKLPSLLNRTQVPRLDDEERITEFMEELTSKLSTGGLELEVKPSLLTAHCRKFVKNLPDVMEQIEVKPSVTVTEHEKLKTRLSAAEKEAVDAQTKIIELNETIEALKATKDKVEVSKVIRSRTSASELFDEYQNAVSEALRDVPRSVAVVAFRELGVGAHAVIDPFVDRDLAEDASSAADDELISTEDGRYWTLNRSHPRIKKLIRAVDKLSRYIDATIPPEFVEQYEAENEFPLSMSNKQYWATLDKRFYRSSL